MGVEAVSLTIAAFVGGALGIAALLRNFRSRLCLSFATMSLSLFLHDTLCVVERFQAFIPFNSPRLHELSILALAPASLWFMYQVLPPLRAKLAFLWWVYVPLCLIVIALGYSPTLASWSVHVSHLFLVIPSGVWLSSFYWAAKSAPLNREKLRYRQTFWNGVITLAFFFTDISLWFGWSLPPLGTFARMLYLVFIFQVYVRKQLLTVEEVLARVALFSGVTVILAIIYSLLTSWIGTHPEFSFFSSLIASSVILILFDPVRNVTAKITKTFFLRKNESIERDLTTLAQEFTGAIGDPIQIAQLTTKTMKRILGAQSTSLFLADREGLIFWKTDKGDNRVEEMSASHPLIEYMMLRSGKPFVWESVENDKDAVKGERPVRFFEACQEGLRVLQADLVIPFTSDHRLMGFLTARTTERAMVSNDQLRLLNPVARQVSVLLRNAEVFSVMRDRDKLFAIGEMAVNLAHEIKNPLGAIKGSAEILEQKVNAPSEREFLEIIKSETDRLSRVLNELLDYAKPRRYQPQKSCDVLQVVNHTIALCRGESRVSFDIKSEGQTTLEADPEILKQVLLNLFLNSIQATEGQAFPRKVQVLIREKSVGGAFAVWAGPQRFIEIIIQDNGPGIPVANRDRVFMPFFTTKPKGTGLGLAICRRLVESMGGTIQLSPHQKEGTSFVIHLPFREEEGEPSSPPSPSMIPEFAV